ncbi:uncharacterized protein EV154DRAFT_580404 [Mucor mucedo]|uniref:uncharacterized protein n=1 Tax=Mucor mucedo TaxID=29922 RepID=UPI002220AED4|nr:uncharacterized protein EV154DRAFT_580404 [Mucor mucedo]KAI7870901.1 hypothetical protein EV154DRAFT_580404 [Mucor mucedo]
MLQNVITDDGRRRSSKQPPVVTGELFFLCDGRITPVALAKKNCSVSSSSSVVSSPTAGPSSSAAPSSSEVQSSSVVSSRCVLASPADVAFSSVFLSPLAEPSVNSEVTQQSFFLRSAPVLSNKMDRQCYSLDFARVAGFPCQSGGGLPSIGEPIKEVSSGASFGFGCEAITQALLAAGIVPAPAFGGLCGPSVGSTLGVGQAFSPLVVSGALSGTSSDVVSDMDIDDVAVPVSGASGVLGESVTSPRVLLGPSVALAPALEEVSGVSLPPCGLDLRSAAVSAVVAEDGSVGGGSSAGETSGVAVAPLVSVSRPVATPRRFRSGCSAEVSSGVCAVPAAATVGKASLVSSSFSSSGENKQEWGKRKNDAPPPPSTVRSCFVRPLGNRKLSLSGSSDVNSLSVAPVASVGSVSSFPAVASVPSFSSFGSVAAVSSVVSVSDVSSVSSVPIVEESSITVSPVRPIAKPRVAHYEKARERLALKDLFDRAEKEEEEEERKKKEKDEQRSSFFRRK